MKPFAGFTIIILTALPAQCPVLNVDYSPVYGQDADLIIGTELFHHGQSSGGAGDKPDIVLCLPLLWPRDTTCRTVLHNHFDRSIISTFAAAPSAWLFIHRIILSWEPPTTNDTFSKINTTFDMFSNFTKYQSKIGLILPWTWSSSIPASSYLGCLNSCLSRHT